MRCRVGTRDIPGYRHSTLFVTMTAGRQVVSMTEVWSVGILVDSVIDVSTRNGNTGCLSTVVNL